MFNDQKSEDKQIIPETFEEALRAVKETERDFSESNGDEQKLLISQVAWDHALDKAETTQELEQLQSCIPKDGDNEEEPRGEKLREKMEKQQKKEAGKNVDGGGIIGRIKKVFGSA
jgi:hypothetical protein